MYLHIAQRDEDDLATLEAGSVFRKELSPQQQVMNTCVCVCVYLVVSIY